MTSTVMTTVCAAAASLGNRSSGGIPKIDSVEIFPLRASNLHRNLVRRPHSGVTKVQWNSEPRCHQLYITILRHSKEWRCFSDRQISDAETASTESESPSSCCTDAAEQAAPAAPDADKEAVSSSSGGSQEFESFGPGKRGNQLVALAAVAVAVGLFAAGRVGGSTPSLPQMAATAMPYEEALGNGKPTVVEFYADWCEVCRETARDVYQVEQEYKDKINFVMLNVDNSKWEQELDEFGVEGIPHFAFLDSKGNEEGNIVGRLPRKILKENLAALARGDDTVPHSRVVGKFSSADSRQAPPVVEPRSHSQMS